MDFLNPYLLWGLLGISVPIVIHLLNRFRYRQIDWAAMELLRRALVTRSRRLRLEDLLLLLLRCVAVLLLALAFARLTLTGGRASWVGGAPDVGAIVAIDGSMSMGHRPGVRTRLDRARERARDVLGTLRTGDPLSLLLLGDRPHILLRDTGLDRERADGALDTIEARPERLGIEEAIREVETLVGELRAPSREVYLVTDAQSSSWQELSDRARAGLARLGESARVLLLPVRPTGEENLAVSRLALASGRLRRGATCRLVAAVANRGRTSAEGVGIRLAVEGVVVDQRTIGSLPAGETVDVPLFVRFDRAGCLRVEARLDPDALPADDRRHLVLEVREQVRVLCVDGEPAPDPYESETGYLVTALTCRDDSSDGSDVFVHSVTVTELEEQRLSDYHVLVLANVAELPSVLAEDVRRFVLAGGGLIVFPGDNALPGDSVLPGDSAVLGDSESPGLDAGAAGASAASLLPAVLAEDVEIAASGRAGRGVRVAAPDHPLGRLASALEPAALDSARVSRLFRLAPLPSARVLLEVSSTGDPLLVERRVGAGQVLLFSTSADREWSDLVRHPLYPMLLQQALTHLTRLPHEIPAPVSSPVEARAPRGALAATTGGGAGPECLDPSGQPVATETVWEAGAARTRVARAARPGFYEFRFPGVDAVRYVAVNTDPLESDATCLAASELETLARSQGMRYVPDGDDVAAAVRESRVGRELWWELLVAALGVLGLESVLAWRFSRAAESPRRGA